MKNNDEILNELFFKKKSYSDKLRDSQAQYTPISDTKPINSLFGGAQNGTPVISDIKEVNKRLVGVLGMALGNNTVKSMANKAIKSFPIIVSDDIAPETLVMIKSMMEEQYASYIDLLISNQIINISDYEPASQDKGNIAIQALNRIDGTDFSSDRLARQMQTGNFTADDLMRNIAGWQVMKTNEGTEFKSGNPITDLFLEDALIVDSSHKDDAIKALQEAMTLTEDFFRGNGNPTDAEIIKNYPGKTPVDGDVYTNMDNNNIWSRINNIWVLQSSGKKPAADIRLSDALTKLRVSTGERNYIDNGRYVEVSKENKKIIGFDKLLAPSAMVDSNNFEKLMDNSASDILLGHNMKDPKLSAVLREKFTKASYLLSSRRISGTEYISYLIDRLGLPVSQKTKQEIIYNFQIKDVVVKGSQIWSIKDNKAVVTGTSDADKLKEAIGHNEKLVLNKIVPQVVNLKASDIAKATMVGAGIGGTIGAGTMGIAAAVASPILWPVYVGLGTGALSGLIYRLIAARIHRQQEPSDNKIEGWERVEMLIDEMDKQQSDVYKKALANSDFNEKDFKEKDDAKLREFTDNMKHVLERMKPVTESIVPEAIASKLTDSHAENLIHLYEDFNELVENDIELCEQMEQLEEANKFAGIKIMTKHPAELKPVKFNSKDVAALVPNFGTRDTLAYGSVEYDKRELKDRKFNEPLLMTISFKERYSDGKYSDNELTAVIGILGVITRVPSEEMTEILKTNAEGKTLNNFFQGDSSNSSKDLISNVISNFMGTKYADKLPTSGKIWANLEKVSHLAIANKLAGTNNGNISNAHIIFSQKEVDAVKNDIGIDYLKNAKLAASLMKRYAAFMIMVCNDGLQVVYSYNDPDSISWDDAPYSAYMGKSNSDQLISAFTQYNRMKL